MPFSINNLVDGKKREGMSEGERREEKEGLMASEANGSAAAMI